MTPTFKLNPNALKWVEALESGKYKQGRDYLTREGRHCCLAVGCLVAMAEGVPVAVGIGYDDEGEHVTYGGNSSHLPDSVRQWLGLVGGEGNYLDPDGRPASLTGDNDCNRHDFQRIAQTIRTTPSLFREATID